MSAYIARRILLMIPTLLGILFVSFVVVQFAPGGPVERVIAQLSGADTGGTSRISGRPAAISARAARSARRRRGQFEIPRRAGARSRFRQEPGKAVRLRQAGAGTLRADGVEFRPLRFRQELFPRCQRAAADQGEAAGLDVARDLDDAPDLPDLDPARHPQGGQGRLEVRHLDLGGDHRRFRDTGISVRDPADHPVRRRFVLQYLPAARTDLRRLVAISLVLEDPRLFLAHHAAADLDGAGRLRHHDAADQELVPRRNPQAICDDRARQGLQRDGRCSTITSSATPC